MTIQDYVIQNRQQSSYPDWQSTPNGDSDGGVLDGGLADMPVGDAAPLKKTNILKSIWNGAKQLLSNSIGMNSNQPSPKYYGENPPYNDGSEFRPYGRFIPEISQRFLLGNEFGSESFNDIFISGFDDPAHLSFKIELGAWGASINEPQIVAALQTQMFDVNVNYSDYDDMPMGLLDLNFGDPESPQINQSTYNAYRYLRNRNEDRRAQYLKDFVEGIYTIQRDMPYIFKSINGLDKLTDFDAKRGLRLREAVIKLTCISEDIGLKIKTLLEMYRKAAWDDIYQRYVLPDIMRYFKMIVYVFDARAVQMGNGMWSPDQENFPIYAYELGPCELVIDSRDTMELTLDYTAIKMNEPVISIRVHNVRTYNANRLFQRVKFIGDILTASQHKDVDDVAITRAQGDGLDWRYQWLMAEFMHNEEWKKFATWHNDYAATSIDHYFGDAGDDATMAMDGPGSAIEVPYDLTWHFATVSEDGYKIRSLKGLWNAVKDIVTSRTQLIRDSRQSDRYYFVNDLYRLDYDTFEYMYNAHLLGVDVEGAERDMVRRIRRMQKHLKDLQLDWSAGGKSKMQMTEIDTSTDLGDQDLTVIEQNDATKFKIDFELSEVSIGDQALTPIQLSNASTFIPNTSIINSSALKFEPGPHIEINPKTEFDIDVKLEDVSIAPMTMDSIWINNAPLITPDVSIINTDALKFEPGPHIWINDKTNFDIEMQLSETSIGQQTLTELQPSNAPVIVPNVSIIDSSALTFKPEPHIIINGKTDISTMTLLLPGADMAQQAMTELLPGMEIAQQQLTELDASYSMSSAPLTELDVSTSIAPQELTSLLLNLDKMKQNLIGLDVSALIGEMTMTGLDVSALLPLQTLTELLMNLEHDVMTMTGIDVNTELPEQELLLMDTETSLMNQELTPIDVSARLAQMQMTLQDVSLLLPEQAMTSLEHNMSQMQQTLFEMNNHATLPEFVMEPLVDNESRSKMTMTGIDANMSQMKQTLHVADTSSTLATQTLISQDVNTELSEMKMIEQDVDAELPDMDLVKQNTDASLADMGPMVRIEESEPVPEQPLVHIELNTEHSPVDVSQNKLNESEHTVADHIERLIDDNTDVPSMNLVNLDKDVSVAEQPLVNLDKDVSIAEQPLVRTDMNVERPQMNLAGLEMNTEHAEMNLVNIDTNTETPDMNMVPQMIDDETGKMSLVEQDINDEHADMSLVNADIDIEHADMNLVELDINDEHADMNLVEPDINDDHQTELRGGDIIMNTEHTAAENAKQTLQNGKVQEQKKRELTLQEKMQMLVNMDMEEVSKAPMNELVKIIGAMEEVISDAQRQMQMSGITQPKKVTVGNKKKMEMPVIDLGERNVFLSHLMANIDDEARERAERAYAKAHTKKNNKD